MALYQVLLNQNIEPQDINQSVNILQQPSGGTESGTFEVAGGTGAAGWTLSCYIASRSRGSTPLSVTINTPYTDGPNAVNTPMSVSHLDANGVQIWTTSNAANVNCHVGSTFTWQY